MKDTEYSADHIAAVKYALNSGKKEKQLVRMEVMVNFTDLPDIDKKAPNTMAIVYFDQDALEYKGSKKDKSNDYTNISSN